MINIEYTMKSLEVEGNEWVKAGTRWYAEPTFASLRLLNGCPCGRADTEGGAVNDLVRRIRIENPGLAFTVSRA